MAADGATASVTLTMPGMYMGETRVALTPQGGGVFRQIVRVLRRIVQQLHLADEIGQVGLHIVEQTEPALALREQEHPPVFQPRSDGDFGALATRPDGVFHAVLDQGLNGESGYGVRLDGGARVDAVAQAIAEAHEQLQPAGQVRFR